MFRYRYISSLILLLIVAHHVCGAQKPERFDQQSSSMRETRLWDPRPQSGSVREISDDRIEHSAASHNQGLRSSLIKPANNQIHAGNFQQSPSIVGQAPRQTDSKVAAATNEVKDSVEFRNHHRHREEQLLESQVLNHATPNRDGPSGQKKEAASSGGVSNLELALRQVSGDESLFHPSSAIPTVGHHKQFDWFAQPTQTGQLEQAQPSTGRRVSLLDQSDVGNRSRNEIAAEISTRAPATLATVMVLVSNETHQHPDSAPPDHHQPEESLPSLNGHFNDQRQKRLQTLSLPQTTASSSIEFNNQVIYEGPVTPPIPTDNYYFSSSEKLPSNNNDYYNEHANSNAWW